MTAFFSNKLNVKLAVKLTDINDILALVVKYVLIMIAKPKHNSQWQILGGPASIKCESSHCIFLLASCGILRSLVVWLSDYLNVMRYLQEVIRRKRPEL